MNSHFKYGKTLDNHHFLFTSTWETMIYLMHCLYLCLLVLQVNVRFAFWSLFLLNVWLLQLQGKTGLSTKVTDCRAKKKSRDVQLKGYAIKGDNPLLVCHQKQCFWHSTLSFNTSLMWKSRLAQFRNVMFIQVKNATCISQTLTSSAEET